MFEKLHTSDYLCVANNILNKWFYVYLKLSKKNVKDTLFFNLTLLLADFSQYF